MATSGNTIKVLTQALIINSALRKLGILGEGVVANATQITTAQEALNIVVAEFRTLGMSVWARTSLNIPLVAGQGTYNIGIGQTIAVPYPMFVYDLNLQLSPYTSSIPMNQYAIIDFNLLPPNSFGTPVNYTYQPQINKGVLSVWPVPDLSVPANSRMVMTYQRPFEVFDAPTNDADFPQEWGNALIYHLALALADEFGVPDSKHSRIERLATTHLGIALSNSNEQGSIFLQPDREGR